MTGRGSLLEYLFSVFASTPYERTHKTVSMSSTSVLRFIKDINAKNVAFVQQRLKGGEKAQQSYCDPARQNTTYSLLHRSVLVGSSEIVAALLRQGADCNGSDSSRRTPLHWLAAAACSSGGRSSGGMEPAECAKIAGERCRRCGGWRRRMVWRVVAHPPRAVLMLRQLRQSCCSGRKALMCLQQTARAAPRCTRQLPTATWRSQLRC